MEETIKTFKEYILSQKKLKSCGKCATDRCEKYARYFEIKLPMTIGYCNEHRSKEMVLPSSKGTWCKNPICFTGGIYVNSDESKELYCDKHRKVTMFPVLGKRCIKDGCTNRARYKSNNSPRLTHCPSHKKDGMFASNAGCYVRICSKPPTYGYTEATACKEHSAVDMKYFSPPQSLCRETGCTKARHYGDPDAISPTHCKDHKTKIMVYKSNYTCKYGVCSKIASFGNAGKPIYCDEHRPLDMKSISHICDVVDCGLLAKAYIPGNPPSKCTKHIEKGMKLYSRTRVNCELCPTTATYGNKDGEAIRCVTCAKGTTMRRVTGAKCEKCNIMATYGTPGKSPNHCVRHRTPGQITKSRSRCKHEVKCRNWAMYGTDKPTKCELHKSETDNNFVEKPCVSCGLNCILDAKGMCENCDPESRKRRTLVKQNKVEDFLKKQGFIYSTCDTMLDHGECVKYRPDFLFFCRGYVVILEVDENQHRGYSIMCENARMMNITSALFTDVVFIRYNPDNYKVDGNAVKIRESDRLRELERNLKHYISDDYIPVDSPSRTTVKYLFYDDYKGNNEELNILDYPEIQLID